MKFVNIEVWSDPKGMRGGHSVQVIDQKIQENVKKEHV